MSLSRVQGVDNFSFIDVKSSRTRQRMWYLKEIRETLWCIYSYRRGGILFGSTLRPGIPVLRIKMILDDIEVNNKIRDDFYQ
jgi:hypothetical protein